MERLRNNDNKSMIDLTKKYYLHCHECNSTGFIELDDSEEDNEEQLPIPCWRCNPNYGLEINNYDATERD